MPRIVPGAVVHEEVAHFCCIGSVSVEVVVARVWRCLPRRRSLLLELAAQPGRRAPQPASVGHELLVLQRAHLPHQANQVQVRFVGRLAVLLGDVDPLVGPRYLRHRAHERRVQRLGRHVERAVHHVEISHAARVGKKIRRALDEELLADPGGPLDIGLRLQRMTHNAYHRQRVRLVDAPTALATTNKLHPQLALLRLKLLHIAQRAAAVAKTRPQREERELRER